MGGLDGDPLPFVPEWSLGLGGDYEWTVFSDARAYVGGLIAYIGERTATSDNRNAPATSAKPTRTRPSTLRTGIIWDRWSIELYGKNVTDEEGITDIRASREPSFPNGRRCIAPIRPRTYRLVVGRAFLTARHR